MILAIDGYEANVSNRVGIGRYAYEIIKNIHQIVRSQNSEVKNEGQLIRIYLPSRPLPDMPQETSWWQYGVLKPRSLWTFFRLPLALSFDRPRADVVFSPTHYIPRFVAMPRVMSIMDLSYREFPELFRKKDLHQLTRWTAYSAKRAARIFTISEFSKRAIIEAYHVPPERVVVTYPGLSMAGTFRATRLTDLAKKYKIRPAYLLSVGTIQPRKNYIRLIEAFATLVSDAALPDLDLVIVGKRGWLYEDIYQAPKRFGVEDRVKFLDFVAEGDLRSLYTHAQSFVLVSLYEGFGIPVLEAMAHACPVVVSNISSLPEIAGDAGMYVDPQDVQDIAKGIRKAVQERGKPAGRKRIATGLARTKLFTWKHAAEQTLAVLEEVGR